MISVFKVLKLKIELGTFICSKSFKLFSVNVFLTNKCYHSCRTEMDPFACVVCDAQKEMKGQLKQCVDWIQAYFCEPQMVEKLPLPAFHHPIFQRASFTSRVLQTLLRDVKFGETVSYKHLAEMAGNFKAVRAVGGAMRSNPVPLLVPCHRVVLSNGLVGNYMGKKGNHIKQWLLEHERQEWGGRVSFGRIGGAWQI
uniref:Methylated-DNA--protein-cysteine methyltransferase n=1 Tax=Erpetoichthys calabaricus TaxID=27687 RepID=A0A8C4SC62_ERPCA